MYLESRPKRRRSSPWRVLILLTLIGIGIYVLMQVRQQGVEPAFVATPTPTRTASSYVFEAQDLYWAGDLRQAIATFERALALDASQLEPYIALARLLALEGRTVEAVQRGEQAVDRAPENGRAWAVLGMAYDWHGEVEQAIETCLRAIEIAPDNAEAYAYLAEAYADNQDWGKATESAETALALDDQSVDVHRNYGYVMEVQGNYTRALQAYKQALAIHPRLAYLHIAVGKNYLALGNYDAAMESFEKAAEVDPGSVEALYRLGRAHYDRGDPQKAQEYLKQATEIDPQFGPAFGYLAFTYWSRRNYEDAIPNLQRAIVLDAWAARQKAQGFVISLESRQGDLVTPSSDVVMTGVFAPITMENTDVLRASLTPSALGEAWQGAQGSVMLDARTGVYTITLEAMPATRYDQAYVGWFEGLRGLAGNPLNTGPLTLDGRSLKARFDATWVQGPRIDYFYTLGLAHFFLDECDKAYPLFNAALQIDPQDENALRGIQLCNEAGSE